MRQPTIPKPTPAPTDYGDLAALLAAVFTHPALPSELRESLIDSLADFDDTRVNFKYAPTEAGIIRQYGRPEVLQEILTHGGNRTRRLTSQ